MSAITQHVEVCIWVAKDKHGNYSSAFSGATGERAHADLARVGHASIKIFTTQDVARNYRRPLKEIRAKDHFYVSLWPGRFVKTHEEDVQNEEGKPNTIVYLGKLDIPKILQKLKEEIDVVNWTLKAKAGSHSCASYVMHLLEVGGIFDKALIWEISQADWPRMGLLL